MEHPVPTVSINDDKTLSLDIPEGSPEIIQTHISVIKHFVDQHNAHIAQINQQQDVINKLIVTGNVTRSALDRHIENDCPHLEPVDYIAVEGWKQII